MKNYSLERHIESHNIEKKLAEQYKDLVWMNSEWTPDKTYDNLEGVPDFLIKDTNLKIEMQKYDFSKTNTWFYMHKRRIYRTDNSKGVYLERKDIKNTYLLLTDGNITAIAKIDELNLKEIEDFPGKRTDWEKAYVVPFNKFKRVDLELFLNCQRTISSF